MTVRKLTTLDVVLFLVIFGVLFLALWYIPTH